MLTLPFHKSTFAFPTHGLMYMAVDSICMLLELLTFSFLPSSIKFYLTMDGGSGKLLVPLLSMGLSYSLDTTNPTVIKGCFAVFVIGAICMASLMFYLRMVITSTNNTKIIIVPDEDAKAAGNPGQVKEITIMDYDQAKLRTFAIQRVLVPIVMISIMYFKFGYVLPLVLMTLNSALGLTNWEIFQIYIQGKSAIGSLERPWSEQQPFGGVFGGEDEAKALRGNKDAKSQRKVKKQLAKAKSD